MQEVMMEVVVMNRGNDRVGILEVVMIEVVILEWVLVMTIGNRKTSDDTSIDVMVEKVI